MATIFTLVATRTIMPTIQATSVNRTAAMLVLYSGSIARLLFGHGRLTSTSIIDVDHALAAFSVGVVGSMLMILTARTFSAIDQFRGIVASQTCALVLYVPLGLLLRSQLGTTGLALAFGLAELAGATFGVGLTARWLDVRLGEIARQVVLPVVVRAAVIFGALAAFRFGVTPRSDVVELAGAALVGVSVGICLLWWSDWPELDRLRSFARRFSLS